MKSRQIAFLSFSCCLAFLSSCGGQAGESSLSSSDSKKEETPLSILSPAGAPTLALYNHIDDENFLTTKDASQVALAMKTSRNKDALIFDGVNGLKFLKGKQTVTSWKLVRWLTGGNFHVVSTKHNKEEAFDPDSKILSFGNGLLPDKVFKTLAKEEWGWNIEEANIKYEAGTSQVSAILGSENFASYDYYFIAEPSLQAAKANLMNLNQAVNVHEIFNLREEWKNFSTMDYIPQAALFVNEESYRKQKDSFKTLLKEVDTNLTDAIHNPSKIVSYLNGKEPDLEKQAAKLGYKAPLINALQKNEANRFGIIEPSKELDNRSFVNGFMEKLGESISFEATFFAS